MLEKAVSALELLVLVKSGNSTLFALSCLVIGKSVSFPFSYNVFKLKSRSGGSERKLSPACCSSLSVLFFPFFFTSRLALLIDFSCCPLGHDFCEKRQKQLASNVATSRIELSFL